MKRLKELLSHNLKDYQSIPFWSWNDLAKAYNMPTIVHTCGSSIWAYEDFISKGIGTFKKL